MGEVAPVLDTNIVLLEFGNRLADPLPDGPYRVSVVTELELLSYPSLDEREEQWIREFLDLVEVVDLTPAVRTSAINVRRAHRLKLPDAIIVGTAIALDAVLVTNDFRLSRIPGLRCRLIGLKPDG